MAHAGRLRGRRYPLLLLLESRAGCVWVGGVGLRVVRGVGEEGDEGGGQGGL